MRLTACVRIACLVSLALFTSFTKRAGAVDPNYSSRLRLPSLESYTSVIHVRKIARTVLHWGADSEDESPIWLGPARARLLWQKKWKWPEPTRELKVPGGLMGGPMLSIDLPFRSLGHLFSLETRLSSLRYTHADQQTRRTVLEELADPQDKSQSVEGRLYLNISFSLF
jgi:hypothetical protein